MRDKEIETVSYSLSLRKGFNAVPICSLIGMIFLFISCDFGKNKTGLDKNIQLYNQYDPSKFDKYGKLNPAAPKASSQFSFMIGQFRCQDSLLVNGEWKTSIATWETHYILNGYGIRDVYRNENYAGESIRIYNTSKNKWEVYFFGMPGEHTGLWEGEKIGNKMVMKQNRTGPNGEHLQSRLTFYDIKDHAFRWKGEVWNLDENTAIVNWKIDANRYE